MSSVKKKKSGPIENDNKLHVSTAYIAELDVYLIVEHIRNPDEICV